MSALGTLACVLTIAGSLAVLAGVVLLLTTLRRDRGDS